MFFTWSKKKIISFFVCAFLPSPVLFLPHPMFPHSSSFIRMLGVFKLVPLDGENADFGAQAIDEILVGLIVLMHSTAPFYIRK